MSQKYVELMNVILSGSSIARSDPPFIPWVLDAVSRKSAAERNQSFVFMPSSGGYMIGREGEASFIAAAGNGFDLCHALFANPHKPISVLPWFASAGSASKAIKGRADRSNSVFDRIARIDQRFAHHLRSRIHFNANGCGIYQPEIGDPQVKSGSGVVPWTFLTGIHPLKLTSTLLTDEVYYDGTDFG